MLHLCFAHSHVGIKDFNDDCVNTIVLLFCGILKFLQIVPPYCSIGAFLSQPCWFM